jgi:hypothetical protein
MGTSVSESPSERRRRDRASKADKPTSPADDQAAPSPSDAPAASPPAPPPAANGGRRWNPNVVWALVTGLAVGFAVGREAYRFGLQSTTPAAGTSEATPFIAAENAGRKVYTRSADFPAGWVKDTDLAKGATLFAGLSDPQKATVMQALNERQCTCGCPFGTLAECLHKDPNCPNSPAIAKMAADLVKQGKSLDEIEAAIDDKQKGNQKPAAAPEAPSKPQYVEVAAWNPRIGPKEAKVTVVLFSDFQ